MRLPNDVSVSTVIRKFTIPRHQFIQDSAKSGYAIARGPLNGRSPRREMVQTVTGLSVTTLEPKLAAPNPPGPAQNPEAAPLNSSGVGIAHGAEAFLVAAPSLRDRCSDGILISSFLLTVVGWDRAPRDENRESPIDDPGDEYDELPTWYNSSGVASDTLLHLKAN